MNSSKTDSGNNTIANDETRKICRHITFVLPEDLTLYEKAVRPDFLAAPPLVEEYSCLANDSLRRKMTRTAPKCGS